MSNSWQESPEQSASRPRAINSNYALQIITKIDPVGVVKRRWQAKRGWQIEHHYQFLSQQKRIRKNNKINRKMNFIAAGEFKFVEGWKWNHKKCFTKDCRRIFGICTHAANVESILSVGFTLAMHTQQAAALKFDIR